MGYQYVRYEPQFRAAILGLERVLWGSDPELNSAYFAWKYERNPFSTGPVFAVALCDGKVAGVRGFHGALWDFPGEQPGMPCFCACDLVVDVAHRNKGIHKRLTEAGLGELSQLGHPLVFNFSANPANYLTSLRTGWRLVQPFDTIRRDSTMAGLAPGRSKSRHPQVLRPDSTRGISAERKKREERSVGVSALWCE